MDIKEIREISKDIFEQMKEYRGAFKENQPMQVSEYYKVMIENNFRLLHIAHGSEVVVSVSDNSVTVRKEDTIEDNFDFKAFLTGFQETLNENIDDIKKNKREYDEKLLKALQDQVKEIKKRLKS